MTRFLSRPEGRIAYGLTSEGPLVVLAHGMGDQRSTWRHVAPALVEAGWRVATVDVRGHGESDTTFGTYAPEVVADDLLALVDELGGPAVLVGHSAAAASVVKAAADAPDKVCAVALVGPVVRDVAPPSAVFVALTRLLFLPFWGARAWGWFYGTLYKAGTPADHRAHVASIVAMLADPARRRAMLAYGMSSKQACAARVDAVRVPVLALVGDRDPDFDPRVEAAWIAEHLRADVRLLPGVGHYPHLEVPSVTLDALVGLLRRLECRAA